MKIKDLQAFNQGVNFAPVGNYTKCCSDVDGLFLVNDHLGQPHIIALEVKKETSNHSVEKIINSNQWKLYENAFIESAYLVYATHDLPISNEPIPTDELHIKRVELIDHENGNKIFALPKNFTFVELLINIQHPNKYLIKAKYESQDEERFCVPKPTEKTNNKWYTDKVISYILYDTVEEARKYIDSRYKNPKYTSNIQYSIYKNTGITSYQLVEKYKCKENSNIKEAI